MRKETKYAIVLFTFILTSCSGDESSNASSHGDDIGDSEAEMSSDATGVPSQQTSPANLTDVVSTSWRVESYQEGDGSVVPIPDEAEWSAEFSEATGEFEADFTMSFICDGISISAQINNGIMRRTELLGVGGGGCAQGNILSIQEIESRMIHALEGPETDSFVIEKLGATELLVHFPNNEIAFLINVNN